MKNMVSTVSSNGLCLLCFQGIQQQTEPFAWNSLAVPSSGAIHGKPTFLQLLAKFGIYFFRKLRRCLNFASQLVRVLKLQVKDVKGPAKPTVPSYANDHHLDRKRLVAAARCATWLLNVGPVMNRLWINSSYPLVN